MVFLLSVQHGIGPENIFFLAGIFKQNSHFLDFVLLFLVELVLVFEEFIHISCLLVTGIDLRLEGTFLHFFEVNFLPKLLKLLAHYMPRV
jgi:hypothetical protein